ncbi:MAG: hypothetical protein HYW48_05070 [Deltaproteobacteria bacterium]|nr:hypothetical protein [Deltaproteobacteria bacterium]
MQEAIWLLEDAGNEQDARSLKQALFSMMTQATIADDGVIELGGGRTVTKLVYFDSGIKGVFKPAISHPSECYRCEIAAYIIDQLGKFALVPMTVEKKIGGKIGSLQYFVEGARDVNKEPNYQKSFNLSAFDYIIRNMDRTAKNVLIANEREVAIDHGNALRLDAWVTLLRSGDKARNLFGISTYPLRQAMTFPRVHPELFRASPRIVEALRRVDHEMLEKHLSNLLPGVMIKKVSEKIAKLLQILDSQPQ